MSKYLYGASVQGIQSFIFQTNKLKEIAGASALIESLCKDYFVKQFGINDFITQTAGNIKCVLDRDKCNEVVKSFPRMAMKYAPGITISQAVVKLTGEEPTKEDVNKLESRLRVQRNRPVMPLDVGFMGLERARRTGGVGVDYVRSNNEEYVADSATLAKIGEREEDTLQLFNNFVSGVGASQVPFDLKDITGKDSDNSWIAIVHADGNSVGRLVQEKEPKEFKKFSENLQMATKDAAEAAFNALAIELDKKQPRYPFRPVILGGDDLTVIIRADLALMFTEAYLEAFEKKTQEKLGKKLTACAGIAYIKQNYPFHYGVDLAEALTKEAKNASKDISEETPPSSLSFYKVLSSFVESLDEMKHRTHKVRGKEGFYFDYGPYFISDAYGRPTVGELKQKIALISENVNDKSNNDNAEKSLKGVGKLRHWLTLLHKDPEEANLYLDRMKQVNTGFYDKMSLDKEREGDKTIIYDVVQLYDFEMANKPKNQE